MDRNVRFHPSVRDADQGLVVLAPGDYVVYSLQYRLGDGDTITKDFQALRCLLCMVISWSAGLSDPEDDEWSDDFPSLVERICRGYRMPSGPLAWFDQRAIQQFYLDYPYCELPEDIWGKPKWDVEPVGGYKYLDDEGLVVWVDEDS